MAPMFPIVTETAHTAEFILSEANGNRSRDNAHFNDPSTIKVGQPVQLVSAATTDSPAVYSAATTGATCHALAIYGGVSSSGNPLRLAVLTRDAEVNLRLINWGAIAPAEQVIGVTTLGGKGIVCRI